MKNVQPSKLSTNPFNSWVPHELRSDDQPGHAHWIEINNCLKEQRLKIGQGGGGATTSEFNVSEYILTILQRVVNHNHAAKSVYPTYRRLSSHLFLNGCINCFYCVGYRLFESFPSVWPLIVEWPEVVWPNWVWCQRCDYRAWPSEWIYGPDIRKIFAINNVVMDYCLESDHNASQKALSVLFWSLVFPREQTSLNTSFLNSHGDHYLRLKTCPCLSYVLKLLFVLLPVT